MFVGGHLGGTVEVPIGQEVGVTGIGTAPSAGRHHADPIDPLERFRRPRLLDHDRRHRHAPACPGDLVVRLLARPVASEASPFVPAGR
jgi:hypothetical protein